MEKNHREATGILKHTGLMFRSSKTTPLRFDFGKEVLVPIHSWFTFFSFIAVWKDKDEKVVESRVIHPWEANVQPDKPFRYLIEIPIQEGQSPEELLKEQNQ